MESEAAGAGKPTTPPRVFTRTTVHLCAFTFLLHLKPSEPHLGATNEMNNGCPPSSSLTIVVAFHVRRAALACHVVRTSSANATRIL